MKLIYFCLTVTTFKGYEPYIMEVWSFRNCSSSKFKIRRILISSIIQTTLEYFQFFFFQFWKNEMRDPHWYMTCVSNFFKLIFFKFVSLEAGFKITLWKNLSINHRRTRVDELRHLRGDIQTPSQWKRRNKILLLCEVKTTFSVTKANNSK